MKDEQRDLWRRERRAKAKAAAMRRPDPVALGEWARSVREIVDGGDAPQRRRDAEGTEISAPVLRHDDTPIPGDGGTGERSVGGRLPYVDD